MRSLSAHLSSLARYTAENPLPSAPAELYAPCDYLLALGGKRLRPALLLMAYELFRDDVETALPAAWAVELFHNFTLMHDDIMDAAPLRRGQPTVQARWGLNTAILSGDAMLIHAYRQLASSKVQPEVLAGMLQTFNRVAIGVCEGQQMDLNFETRSDVTLAEYLRMIELKTAVLLGGALEMGALCAGAGPDQADLLYQFGCMAGTAFQIQDDLLDTYGDPAKFGKQVGGDIVQNKKTYLLLRALETAAVDDRRELKRWLGKGSENPEEKIAAVRAIFDRNAIPALAAAEQRQFQDGAFSFLDKVKVGEERKQVLRDAVAELFQREF